ncbi:MAG: GDP-mannose 4,6-dehydratase, partial [Elusimicrobia bacterium]|nr:GDP-mannose 4,6-dehydratase [Elusimicrobiota bacterium]
EIYHLGAQSHVRVSFDLPEYTGDVTGLGTLRLLDAIRETGIRTKFYQASSSEMFGKALELPIKETTPFYPRSPYGVAKVYAYWITKNYRESYGMFAVNGILFNHESERRGETFVTRKITHGLARIKLGRQERLYLGNLDARRDWGYAKDFVEAMWLMLRQKRPEDFIIATGETHSVREFVEETADFLGFKLAWKGKGLREKGVDRRTGKTLIELDPIYLRPAEVDVLLGDSSKARRQLGWRPKVTFKELVRRMAQADLDKESARPA